MFCRNWSEDVVGRSVKCRKGLDVKVERSRSRLEEASAPATEKYQRRFQYKVWNEQSHRDYANHQCPNSMTISWPSRKRVLSFKEKYTFTTALEGGKVRWCRSWPFWEMQERPCGDKGRRGVNDASAPEKESSIKKNCKISGTPGLNWPKSRPFPGHSGILVWIWTKSRILDLFGLVAKLSSVHTGPPLGLQNLFHIFEESEGFPRRGTRLTCHGF